MTDHLTDPADPDEVDVDPDPHTDTLHTNPEFREAYRSARDSGLDHEAAIEAAVEAVLE